MDLQSPGNGHSLGGLRHDLRFAVRTLRRRPAYTGTILLTLVLAIGASTAVFSVVHGVLLSPLPHPHPEELVLVYEVDARGADLDDHNPVAAANYGDWRAQNRTFRAMANFAQGAMTFQAGGEPRRVTGVWGGEDFFAILAVEPYLGRVIVPGDAQPDASRVAVLGHAFWVNEFGGDSSIIGTTVQIQRQPTTVIGVTPPGFRFMDRLVEVWLPWPMTAGALQNRRSHSLSVIARLQADVTVEDAQRDMDRVVAGLRDVYPEFLTGWGANVVSLTDELVGSIRSALLVLLSAVGFVLLIAAVNVANLMLTRSVAEQREMAIRTALGAGRSRLVRQKLTEGAVLGFAGGAMGIGVAHLATQALLRVAPDQLPRTDQVGIDPGVLTFALAVTLVTSFGVGLAPALQGSKANLSGGLKDGSRAVSDSRGHHRLRGSFAVAQLAFSLMLLVSAGLMMTTFARLLGVDPGFEPGGVASLKVGLPSSKYGTTEDQIAFLEPLLAGAAAQPGVRSVGITPFLPLLDFEGTWSLQIVGNPDWKQGEKRDYGWHAVNADYFATMGMRLVRGRTFTAFDNAASPNVVVVNQAFVRRFFDEGEDPIGRHMFVITSDSAPREIVGIVDNVLHYALDGDPAPSYYMPYNQANTSSGYWLGAMNLVLRTTGDPTLVLSSTRRLIRDMDGDVLVSNLSTMQDHVGRSVARTRFATVLLNVFAGVALSLAIVGIYGVIAYAVGQRTQEIGLRMALGAQPGAIVGAFLGSGFRLVMVGLGLGLVGSYAFTRFQASLLFGVEAFDPATYAAVTALLMAVALVAMYVPARRATRVDPMAVLREE
jgi:putative ABC transport system permease protein